MKLLGVTGGVGMGKSTAAEFLRQAGVAVVDTDKIAREVVEPGKPALEEIRREFGAHFIGQNGRLLRSELARLVFSDAAARSKLEAILHPRIRAAWQQEVEVWKKEGREVGAVIIPLLYETDAASFFSSVLCVACSSETQRRRLSDRGWTQQEIDRRNAAQWPVERKMNLADFVVWTEGRLEVHAAQLRRVLQMI